jgi:hypothetical protein
LLIFFFFFFFFIYSAIQDHTMGEGGHRRRDSPASPASASSSSSSTSSSFSPQFVLNERPLNYISANSAARNTPRTRRRNADAATAFDSASDSASEAAETAAFAAGRRDSSGYFEEGRCERFADDPPSLAVRDSGDVEPTPDAPSKMARDAALTIEQLKRSAADLVESNRGLNLALANKDAERRRIYEDHQKELRILNARIETLERELSMARSQAAAALSAASANCAASAAPSDDSDANCGLRSSDGVVVRRTRSRSVAVGRGGGGSQEQLAVEDARSVAQLRHECDELTFELASLRSKFDANLRVVDNERSIMLSENERLRKDHQLLLDQHNARLAGRGGSQPPSPLRPYAFGRGTSLADVRFDDISSLSDSDSSLCLDISSSLDVNGSFGPTNNSYFSSTGCAVATLSEEDGRAIETRYELLLGGMLLKGAERLTAEAEVRVRAELAGSQRELEGELERARLRLHVLEALFAERESANDLRGAVVAVLNVSGDESASGDTDCEVDRELWREKFVDANSKLEYAECVIRELHGEIAGLRGDFSAADELSRRSAGESRELAGRLSMAEAQLVEERVAAAAAQSDALRRREQLLALVRRYEEANSSVGTRAASNETLLAVLTVSLAVVLLLWTTFRTVVPFHDRLGAEWT